MNRLRLSMTTCVLLYVLAISGAAAPAQAGEASSSKSYIALGDSITAGSHATEEKSRYVARYRCKESVDLDTNLVLDNLGRGGDTSADLLDLILHDQQTREEIQDARVITVYIGYNDIRMPRLDYRRGTGGGLGGQKEYRKTLNQFRKNYSRIMYNVDRLASPDAKITTGTVYYPQAGDEADLYRNSRKSVADVHRYYLARMNHVITYSSKRHRAKVAPVYTRFNGFRENGTRRDPDMRGYIADDGIHPNDRGHQVIAAAFTSAK